MVRESIFRAALATHGKNVKERLFDTIIPASLPRTERLILPDENVMAGLMLKLRTQMDIVGGAASGTLYPEQVINLIRNIKIRVSSSTRPALSGELYNIEGASAYRLAHFLYGRAQRHVPLVNGDIQAATILSATYDLPYELIGTNIPRSTMIKGAEIDKNGHELVVDFGAETDLITGGDRTETLTNTTLEVWIKEFVDPRTRLDADFGARYQRYIEVPVTAAVTIPIDVKSNMVCRGYLVHQFTRVADPGPKTPVETIINSLELKINRETLKIWEAPRGFEIIQDANRKRQSVIPAGYAFIDFAADGLLDSLFDTSPPKTAVLHVNVNNIANGIVRIYPVEILDANL